MRIIDITGYHHIDRSNDFIAIAPFWYSDLKQPGDYPHNHYCFKGKVVHSIEVIERMSWYPDNIHSDETWHEVRLYLNKLIKDPTYHWQLCERHCLSSYSGGCPTWRFFLPRQQLREFYYLQPRSTDRFPVEHQGRSTYDLSHATCLD